MFFHWPLSGRVASVRELSYRELAICEQAVRDGKCESWSERTNEETLDRIAIERIVRSKGGW
jgi:hypothetical protein